MEKHVLNGLNVFFPGGYRDALRFRPGEQITFDPDAFVLSRPANMQPFLNKALQLQTFQQFVADRLDMLNSGLGFSDEFDVQVNLYGDKWGAQSRYKDWLNHMKVSHSSLLIFFQYVDIIQECRSFIELFGKLYKDISLSNLCCHELTHT